jgi:biofilm protein TabA
MKISINRVHLSLILLSFLYLSACSESRSSGSLSKEEDQWYESGEWLNGLPLKPHETINQSEFKKQYQANQKDWDRAFAFLKESDLPALKPGKHPIDGENVFVLVTEGPPKEPEKAAWEGHKNYIDIHYVVSGKEKIGLAPVASATLTKAYDASKDIAFYTTDGRFYEADTSTFLIIFPENAHCPGVKVDGYDTVKKIVIKVRKSA